jgi:monoamine oxidase
MAASLGNRIQYGARIAAIANESSKVRLAVQSGGSQQVVEADYAICTLPYTVLRELPVTPPLNPARYAALHRLPVTSVVRVCLEFTSAFWLKENLNGVVVSDLPIALTYPQPNQPGPSAVLNQLLMGDNARRMAARSEADRLQYTLEEMPKFYPQAPGAFLGGVSKVWDTDPWARGAYAYFAPGQMTKYLPVFQPPSGRREEWGCAQSQNCTVVPPWQQRFSRNDMIGSSTKRCAK